MTSWSGISLAATALIKRSDASVEMFNLGLEPSDALEECHSVVDLLHDVEDLADALLVRRHDLGDDPNECSPTHLASISRADAIRKREIAERLGAGNGQSGSDT